ncbi:MAG: transglycosylase SLT domain-containing protein [Nitrospirae bacterium]|nr:transglycosylase SLT domain-containing protein [Nitrospirota bacterium]
MKKSFLFLAVFLVIFSAASGENTDGKSFFIKGKSEFDAGRYAGAIENLSEAYKRLPVVRDYILFYLSKAYSESGNLSESNLMIKELLEDYPSSPLRKRARGLGIKNLISSGELPHNTEILESYVRDYPEDNEMKFLFARHLKDKGETERAKAVFKNIYLGSDGMFSKISYNELAASDITLQDIIEKAANLTSAMEFKKAESALREALAKDDGQRRIEIIKKLGHVLFKQKRYKESADAYEKAGDYYLKAKALYRTGDKTGFDRVLKKLSLMDDKRTGSLLILAALDKRRNGEINEALNLYQTIKEKYPPEIESAQWGIAWTYYRAGSYQKALDVFTDLYDSYGSSKYLYWKAQSLERTGGNADHIYRQLAVKTQDFYSILPQIKKSHGTENPPSLVASGDSFSSANPDSMSGPGREPSGYKPFKSERIEILLEAGMTKEAAAELSAIARKTMNPDELISVSLKLQECGEYREALTLLSRLPSGEVVRNILYPLAHWHIVRNVSEKYSIDPFIILSIMREESRFDTQARSQAGALGLMQLMPQTAYAIDKKVNLNIKSQENIFDIKANINLGSYYITSLLKEFGSLPPAIAAYNAGEDIVRKWQRAGNYKSLDEFIEDIPYEETKNYTKRVITTYFEYRKYTGEKSAPEIL